MSTFQVEVGERDGYIYKIHPAYRRNWQAGWGFVILRNGSEVADGWAETKVEAEQACHRRIAIELDANESINH